MKHLGYNEVLDHWLWVCGNTLNFRFWKIVGGKKNLSKDHFSFFFFPYCNFTVFYLCSFSFSSLVIKFFFHFVTLLFNSTDAIWDIKVYHHKWNFSPMKEKLGRKSLLVLEVSYCIFQVNWNLFKLWCKRTVKFQLQNFLRHEIYLVGRTSVKQLGFLFLISIPANIEIYVDNKPLTAK